MTLNKRILYFLTVLALASGQVKAHVFFTHPLHPDIKTLQCVVDGDCMKPAILPVQGNSTLCISFDHLADASAYVSYRVTHCDRDWNPSDISELDYLEGFQPVRVEDMRPSFNTYVNYFHYSVTFPNEDVQLKLSGNYAVEFFYDEDPDEVFAVATFSMAEGGVFVDGEVSVSTDVDYKAQHQQLGLELKWSPKQLTEMNPYDDLSLKLTQNNRIDTERTLEHPSRVLVGRAYYEHLPELIFEAGNNYRRFEYINERYAAMGIDHVEYRPPLYYVYLQTATPKVNVPYLYDQDQDGRFVVNAVRVDDVDVEADYFQAVFTLDLPSRQGVGDVYLSGDFTYNLSDETCRMEEGIDAYSKTMLLKQGLYNYQYLTRPSHDGPMTASQIEGNHFEAGNEYLVRVYYRPSNQRYDRLIGYGILKK